MVMKTSYAIFPFLCILFLLIFFIQLSKHSPRQQSHASKHQTRIEKALVVVTRSQEASRWMNDVDPSWTKYIYIVTEDALPSNSNSNITLSVPVNKGNEAMRYLSFIIDHYDNLPNIIAFRHGHLETWHQHANATSEVNYLNLTTVRQRGYQSFRCTLHDGLSNHDCPAEGETHVEDNDKSYWDSVEPELTKTYGDLWDAWFGGTRPEYLMAACCAQFVVTRESVMRRSKEKYMEYRQWLIETELEDYFSGRVFERSWHVVFGKGAVSCEKEEECFCQVYTGPLGCNGGAGSS